MIDDSDCTYFCVPPRDFLVFHFQQVMTIADQRPFVIVEKQHVHFFDFGLWQNVLSKFLLF